MDHVLDIYKTAVELVREYGHDAELEAAKCVKAMHDQHDVVGQGLWRGVLKAVAEIQGQALSTEFQKVLDLPRNGKAHEDLPSWGGPRAARRVERKAEPQDMQRTESAALQQMRVLERAISVGVPTNLDDLAAKLRYIVWSSDISGDEHTVRVAREALEGLERMMAQLRADAAQAE